MSKSIPATPRSIDPDLRRVIESLRGSVLELSGAVRTTAAKSGQFVTVDQLIEKFPSLLVKADVPAAGDSVYGPGVWENGVFMSDESSAGTDFPPLQTLWAMRPTSVGGPTWTDKPGVVP